MKIAPVVFWWADVWREGVIMKNDAFQGGYCIQFGPYQSSRVALDYVTQWYYEDDPGTIFENKRR